MFYALLIAIAGPNADFAEPGEIMNVTVRTPFETDAKCEEYAEFLISMNRSDEGRIIYASTCVWMPQGLKPQGLYGL